MSTSNAKRLGRKEPKVVKGLESLKVIPTRSISVAKMQVSCQEVSDLLRALSHPQRLMVMGHLSGGRKTVGELQDLCDSSQSQLSQFLSRMKAEGLVASERDGKYQYYRVANDQVVELMSAIQGIFCK